MGDQSELRSAFLRSAPNFFQLSARCPYWPASTPASTLSESARAFNSSTSSTPRRTSWGVSTNSNVWDVLLEIHLRVGGEPRAMHTYPNVHAEEPSAS